MCEICGVRICECCGDWFGPTEIYWVWGINPFWKQHERCPVDFIVRDGKWTVVEDGGTYLCDNCKEGIELFNEACGEP